MTSPEDPFRTPPPGGSPQPGPGSSPYGPPPSGGGTPPPGQPGPSPYGSPPAGFGGPPPGYGAPGGPAPYGTPVRGTRNGLGTASLVLGVLGLVTSLFFVGGLLGLVAIVLGVIGRGRAKRGEASNGGVALAGIITGTVALLIGIAVVAGTIALFSNGDFGSFTECVEAAQDQAERDRCAEEFEDSVTQ